MNHRVLGLVSTTAVVLGLTPGAAVGAETETTQPRTPVRVLAANLHEGSIDWHPSDMRDPADRRTFARRLLRSPGGVPDVLLLQETLGSAGRVARALNRAGDKASYDVATGTRHGYSTSGCDGARVGRVSVLRSSSILVNRHTVTGVLDHGFIRTWGRWQKSGMARLDAGKSGCTEHPWVRLTVQRPGTAPTTALVVSVHLAPRGASLKNGSMGTIRGAVGRLRAREDVVVVGGDWNLTRCRQPVKSAERRACDEHLGHQQMLDAGYVDAIRSRHLTGPRGVVGVARRIDLLYVGGGTVGEAWYDRCYSAYWVERWACGTRAVFRSRELFHRCQDRTLDHGRPGGGCDPRQYRRYYSDHPMLRVTVS